MDDEHPLIAAAATAYRESPPLAPVWPTIDARAVALENARFAIALAEAELAERASALTPRAPGA